MRTLGWIENPYWSTDKGNFLTISSYRTVLWGGQVGKGRGDVVRDKGGGEGQGWGREWWVGEGVVVRDKGGGGSGGEGQGWGREWW